MKVLDIFETLHHKSRPQPLLIDQIKCIRTECSQYLSESGSLPVYKSIAKDVGFVKLKARIRKERTNDLFSENFNNAFSPKLRQRAIYAHGTPQQTFLSEQQFFLFPINGYQYVFNTQITDSTIYEGVFNDIGDNDIFTELLQQNYSNSNLTEGIESGAEVLFHDIPYCYAVNTSCFDSYKELLSVF